MAIYVTSKYTVAKKMTMVQTLAQGWSRPFQRLLHTSTIICTLTIFFSSVDLMEALLHDGIYACGTYCKDRKGLPPTVVHTKIGMFTEKNFNT